MKKRISILAMMIVSIFVISFGERTKASGDNCPYMQSCTPSSVSQCGDCRCTFITPPGGEIGSKMYVCGS